MEKRTPLGAVFRPSDMLRRRRRFVEELTRDLDPSKRETVIRILESWREDESEQELIELIGQRMARKLLRTLKPEE